jgi:hypothetical protein
LDADYITFSKTPWSIVELFALTKKDQERESISRLSTGKAGVGYLYHYYPKKDLWMHTFSTSPWV